ncbi:MAG: hypothetical protein K8S94_08095 [Planctomycetia bacterium]|nr:hypothetical protein [Planctomycetia bacterium]
MLDALKAPLVLVDQLVQDTLALHQVHVPDSVGQGDVTIDVATGTVTLEHQENVTETRDSTQAFTLRWRTPTTTPRVQPGNMAARLTTT